MNVFSLSEVVEIDGYYAEHLISVSCSINDIKEVLKKAYKNKEVFLFSSPKEFVLKKWNAQYSKVVDEKTVDVYIKKKGNREIIMFEYLK